MRWYPQYHVPGYHAANVERPEDESRSPPMSPRNCGSLPLPASPSASTRCVHREQDTHADLRWQRLRRTGAILLLPCAVVVCLGGWAVSRRHHLDRWGGTPRATAMESLWSIFDTNAGRCSHPDPAVADLRTQTWPRISPPPLPTVTNVIYINLEWDKARRAFMEQQLRNLSDTTWTQAGLDLRWQRFDAVDKHDLRQAERHEQWRAKGFSQTKHPDVDGKWAIGACSYSHYSAIRELRKTRYQMEAMNQLTMIVEDDVQIDWQFPQSWEKLWSWVPDDWDVLRVGWFGDYQNCTQVVNAYCERARWQQEPADSICMYCGAQAYIVNPRSLDKVLQRFENSKMTHSDILLGAGTPPLEDPAKVPPLQVFAFRPMLAMTKANNKGYPAFPSDRREIDLRKGPRPGDDGFLESLE